MRQGGKSGVADVRELRKQINHGRTWRLSNSASRFPFIHPMKIHPRNTLVAVLFAFICALPLGAQTMPFSAIEKLPRPPADHRIAYGNDLLQFGELRLPKTKGKHPVVIVVHGGCWFAEYDLHHLAAFSDALTKLGVATWTIEYRRIGNQGGAWPGTFQDVAQAADYLRVLAKKYPLDIQRVIAIGHSAGGQLALWLAARKNLPKTSELYTPKPLPLAGVVALAGISDLKKYRPHCDDSVNKLLGGSPEQFAERYQQTSPIELLPLKVPVTLLHGAKDRIVPPEQSQQFAAAAQQKGDEVVLTRLDEAGHFELISPQAKDWTMIEKAVLRLLNPSKPSREVQRK
jgi:acetyl esterase/lipase